MHTIGRLLWWLLLLQAASHGVAVAQAITLPVQYVLAQSTNSTSILPQKVPATYTIDQAIEAAKLAAYRQGFIGFSVDSCVKTDTSFIAWIYMGRQYYWKQIKGLPYMAKPSGDKPLANVNEVWKATEDMLQQDAFAGYPFATVELRNWQVDGDSIMAEFAYKKGSYTAWLSTVNKGTARLKPSFLNKHLQIQPGAAFNEQIFLQADKLLEQLPYVAMEKPTELVLNSSGASLHTYLQNKAANEVNAIIGFLPQNPLTGGRTQIVGDAVVNLKNIFNAGEQLYLNWQQLQPASPRLQLQYIQPFVGGSRYNLAAQFELFRRDSSFLQLQLGIKLSVPIAKQQMLSLGYQLQNSSLLTIDTNRVLATGALPRELDFTTQTLLVAYTYGKLVEYQRMAGWQAQLWLQAGTKRIQKNATITGLKAGANFDELYNQIGLNSFQAIAKPSVQKNWLAGKSALIKLSTQGGVLFTGRALFNELFQIGGIKLLRGFNEQQFFVQQYAVNTLEYKYFIAPESCLYGFADVGWLHQPFIENGKGWATGIGAGLYLKTGTGVLNLAWAVGRWQNEPFNFRQSKLHIGFSALL